MPPMSWARRTTSYSLGGAAAATASAPSGHRTHLTSGWRASMPASPHLRVLPLSVPPRVLCRAIPSLGNRPLSERFRAPRKIFINLQMGRCYSWSITASYCRSLSGKGPRRGRKRKPQKRKNKNDGRTEKRMGGDGGSADAGLGQGRYGRGRNHPCGRPHLVPLLS